MHGRGEHLGRHHAEIRQNSRSCQLLLQVLVSKSVDSCSSILIVFLRTSQGWLQPEVEYVWLYFTTFEIATEFLDMCMTFASLLMWIRHFLFQSLTITKWNLSRFDLAQVPIELTRMQLASYFLMRPS
jgi:hypothetical protein